MGVVENGASRSPMHVTRATGFGRAAGGWVQSALTGEHGCPTPAAPERARCGDHTRLKRRRQHEASDAPQEEERNNRQWMRLNTPSPTRTLLSMAKADGSVARGHVSAGDTADRAANTEDDEQQADRARGNSGLTLQEGRRNVNTTNCDPKPTTVVVRASASAGDRRAEVGAPHSRRGVFAPGC